MQALPLRAVAGDRLHQLVKEHSPILQGGPIFTGLPLPPLLFTRSNSTLGVRDVPATSWYGRWSARRSKGGGR